MSTSSKQKRKAARERAAQKRKAARDANRAALLERARRTAERVGLYTMSRADVAKAAGVSDALVSHHFGTMNDLRGALIQAAIGGQSSYLGVLAQALTMRDRRAAVAPAEVKRAALNTAA